MLVRWMYVMSMGVCVMCMMYVDMRVFANLSLRLLYTRTHCRTLQDLAQEQKKRASRRSGTVVFSIEWAAFWLNICIHAIILVTNLTPPHTFFSRPRRD